jgi:UDP-4-amino-4,6-dideoxy-N-acetyl-beta-L-altrosamine N-acetyltransferase
MDYKLRSINDSDKERILTWRNSDRVRRNMYTDHLITPEEHESWCNKIHQDESVDYKIFECEGRSIGLVGFTQINRLHNTCYWAFYLGEVDVPAKSGAVMEFMALDYAFKELEIRKLCCEVFCFNEKVVKMHKKFGFRQEDLFIKHKLKAGQHEDVVFLVMFEDDWTGKKDEMSKLLFRI